MQRIAAVVCPESAVVMRVETKVYAYDLSEGSYRRNMMLHPTIVVMLIALSTILLSSPPATAFTLRFGPLASSAHTVPGAEGSDIPTPQLFRVAVDSGGATLGTISPTEGYGAPQPALRLRKRNVAPLTETAAAMQQASPRVEKSITDQRLSGAELLLLRKTSVVADRRAD